MIKIKVKKDEEIIREISINGHALYDDYGKDIVCASVSSIVITTVNAILRVDSGSISYDENPFVIRTLKDSYITNLLLDNMISLLKELERDYPKNVRFL